MGFSEVFARLKGADRGTTASLEATVTAIDGNHAALDVNVLSAGGSGLTDAQLRATPVPVSGTVATGGLTDGQLRASAVPTSLATLPALAAGAAVIGHVIVDTAPTTAVTGPLTDTQLRASAVPVSLASVPSHAVTNAGTFPVQADTELPAAAALTDASANPTTPSVGANGLLWNGATWDRAPGTTRGTWVEGAVASGAADSGNPVKFGGRNNTTPPTLADAQRGDAQLDTRGNLRVTLVGTGSATGSTGMDTNSDGRGATGTGIFTPSMNHVFNGTSWDRARGDATNGQLVRTAPATLAVTGTAAAAAGVTVTLAAAGAGLFHYITRINIIKYASVATVGAAAPTVITSTNLPGAVAWTLPTALAVGTQYETDVEPASPVKSSVANTATTIVAAGLASIIYRITVYYYTGP